MNDDGKDKKRFLNQKYRENHKERLKKQCRDNYARNRDARLQQKKKYWKNLSEEEKQRRYKLVRERYRRKHPVPRRIASDYRCLHKWARKNVPKSESCTACNKIKKLEIANISGAYKREVFDWEWICHSCHQQRHRNNDYAKDKRFVFNKKRMKWEENPVYREGVKRT